MAGHEKVYVLSPEDVQILREIVADWRRRRASAGGGAVPHVKANHGPGWWPAHRFGKVQADWSALNNHVLVKRCEFNGEVLSSVETIVKLVWPGEVNCSQLKEGDVLAYIPYWDTEEQEDRGLVLAAAPLPKIPDTSKDYALFFDSTSKAWTAIETTEECPT